MGIELRIFTTVPGRRWGGGGGGGARPLIEAQRCNWAAENVLLVREGGGGGKFQTGQVSILQHTETNE